MNSTKMNKLLIITLFLLFGFNAYTQTRFEKGYFIKNDGTKIDCFIKNIDWRNNPDNFEYKLTQSTKIEKETIERVKKFTISDKHVYERFMVEIDTSSSVVRNLDKEKNPKLKKEILFLKRLVTGKANLYSFQKSLLKRHFYSFNNEIPKQLIYKKYLIHNEKKGREEIAINNQYKRQLLIDLVCESIYQEDIEHITYNEKSLIKHFEKYNTCIDPNIEISSNKETKKDLFNLSLKGGVKSASLTRRSSYSELDLGNQTSLYLGIEAEFILPFNNNKWSLLVEPTYSSYQGQAEAPIDPFFSTIEIDYTALTFPIGLRHSFYLKEESKVFINVLYKFYISDISFEDTVKFLPGLIDGKSDLRNLAIFGAGFKFGKNSLEVRYGSNSLFESTFSKKYNEASIIYGYSIF